MDKIDNINVERIMWCCANARISTDDLAQRSGIANTTLDKLLAKEDSITFKQLKKVADLFNRGVLFFLEDGPVNEEQLFTAAFRTIANQKFDLDLNTRALIERAERQREIYLSLIEDREDELQRFSHPELPEEPEHAASLVREWLQLTERNDFSTFRSAVEKKGILVFLTNGYQGRWQTPKANPVIGFSLYHEYFPLIVVKKASHEARQSFTLIHELAHILIHRKSMVDEEKDLFSHAGKERAANQFAANLLVPLAFLNSIEMSQKPDEPELIDDWLRPYRNRWGVSTEALLLRLLSVGRLEQSEYDNYKAWHQARPAIDEPRGTRLYRHREPRNVFGDPYVRSVLDALDQEKITLNKASKFLDGLKVTDIRKLEHYCASL